MQSLSTWVTLESLSNILPQREGTVYSYRFRDTTGRKKVGIMKGKV